MAAPSASDGRVVMEHVLHPQPGYPFTLRLAHRVRAVGRGLSVRHDRDERRRGACPYGAGAHPYLTLGTATVDALVAARPGAEGAAIRTSAACPTGTIAGRRHRVRLPPSRAPIGATKLDNAFTDLERDGDGLARVELRDPSGGASTSGSSESYRYVMVFSGDPLPDVSRRSLAVEPMTCPPNAFAPVSR